MERTIPTANGYDQLGALYDAWVGERTHDVRWYCNLALQMSDECQRALRILELGAGSGRITGALLAGGHAVVALDNAPSQLELLRRTLGGTPGLSIVEGDLLHLGDCAELEPASFDLVIAPFRCLMHVAHARETVFGEIRRLLTPGGRFAFDVAHLTAAQLRQACDWDERRTIEWEGRALSIQERVADQHDGSFEMQVRTVEVESGSVLHSASLYLGSPTRAQWRASLARAGYAVYVAQRGWGADGPHQDSDDSLWVVGAEQDG